MTDLPGWLKHGTVWLLLAVGLFLGVQAWLGHQGRTQFAIDGGTVEIRRGFDGHYHWPGRVGDREVEFLVDTGASGTAIPAALADELGLKAVGRVRSQTANGMVEGEVVVGDLMLQGGLRADRLRMVALPGLAAPLLGMDVLGRLQWQQRDGTLRFDLRGQTP